MTDPAAGTFEDAEAQAILAGLGLTPAERLNWLEEALAFVEWSRGLERVDHAVVPAEPAGGENSGRR